jgi:hypothetical protein
MLDPSYNVVMHLSAKDPRARAQRIVTYILIAIFVSIGTFLLTRYTQGYKLDPETLELVQNGLVIAQSEPVKSIATVNNRTQKSTTPSRLTLPIGKHSIELNADGYRPWRHSFSIVGSDLIWFNYPLLVPEKIITTRYKTYSDKPLVSQSPDNKIIITNTKEPNEFLLTKQDSGIAKDSLISIPEQILASVDGYALSDINFAPNNRQALFKYKKADDRLYIHVDTKKPENSMLIVPAIKGLHYKDLQFGNTDGSTLYGLEKTDLYRIEVGSQPSALIIAQDVLEFKSQSDIVSFVQETEAGTGKDQKPIKRLGYTNSKDRIKFIDNVIGDGPFLLSQAKFKSNLRIAITSGTETRVYSRVGEDRPIKPRVIDVNANQLAFSGNGRFLSIIDGQSVATLDFEFDKTHKFKFKNALSSDITWLDNFHLGVISGGFAQIIDYDGANPQDIVEATGDMRSFFDSRKKLLFTSSISNGSLVINKSQMVVTE